MYKRQDQCSGHIVIIGPAGILGADGDFAFVRAKSNSDTTHILSLIHILDWKALHQRTVDKHSTGGVGDKTTLIVVPIVASLGVVVPKMSGRGLGHTGGTIDKLSAIPGFQTQISQEHLWRLLEKNHAAIIAQSGNLAPADKILYALRDVTATVDSLPLIASSIMSKKLALGANAILLDVKTGSGALMRDLDGSIRLARTMVELSLIHILCAGIP